MTLQWRAIQRKTKPEIDWDQIWWAPPPTLSFSFRFIFLWRLCLDWNQNQSKISRIHRKYERMLTLFLCSKLCGPELAGGWLHFWTPVEFSRSKKNTRSDMKVIQERELVENFPCRRQWGEHTRLSTPTSASHASASVLLKPRCRRGNVRIFSWTWCIIPGA